MKNFYIIVTAFTILISFGLLFSTSAINPELYKGDLFEFEMAVPSVEKQKKILRTISSAKQLALCLDATSHSAIEVADVLKLQNLRDRIDHFYGALLPIILSGRLIGEQP